MKTSIFMSKEVKEQVMARRKGETNGLKDGQRRSRKDKPWSFQAGAEQELPPLEEDSCRINGLAELRVLAR